MEHIDFEKYRHLEYDYAELEKNAVDSYVRLTEELAKQSRFCSDLQELLRAEQNEKRALLEEKQMLENEKRTLPEEKQMLENEKRALLEEKQMLENEKQALLEEKQMLENEKRALLEEKQMLENEILRLEEIINASTFGRLKLLLKTIYAKLKHEV